MAMMTETVTFVEVAAICGSDYNLKKEGCRQFEGKYWG